MGFNCIECGDREIWSFETLPNICMKCFKNNHDWPKKIKFLPIEIQKRIRRYDNNNKK